jgi:hypothetical protein
VEADAAEFAPVSVQSRGAVVVSANGNASAKLVLGLAIGIGGAAVLIIAVVVAIAVRRRRQTAGVRKATEMAIVVVPETSGPSQPTQVVW